MSSIPTEFFSIKSQMFTFINEYGDEINTHFKDIPYYLTVKLLEKNWNSYKYLLDIYTEYRKISNINTYYIEKVLNSTSDYDNWFSSHVQSLSYLVGDHDENIKNIIRMESPNSKWYGDNTCIPDEVGCEILDLMMKNGAKINVPNYYGNTVHYTISNKSLTSRVNNKKFVSKLKCYFSKL